MPLLLRAVPAAAAAAAAVYIRALMARQQQRKQKQPEAGRSRADLPYGADGQSCKSVSLNGPRACGGALPGPPMPNNPKNLRAQRGLASRRLSAVTKVSPTGPPPDVVPERQPLAVLGNV